MRENNEKAVRQIVFWTFLVLFLGASVSGCSLGATDSTTRGRELFQNCAPCHQPNGSGNSEIGAPHIAGMKAWYVQQELHKFRTGARGNHFSDVEGMRMRPIALSLAND